MAIDYLLKEVKVRNLQKYLILKGRFIKGDRTKHISQKLLYTHELQKNGDINVQQIRSSDNVG